MLRSVLWSGGAIAALFAGSAFAQTAAAPSIAGAIPSANIGSTIGAGAQIGAPGALGGSITGSPLTPGSPLPANPSVTGSLFPSAATTTSVDGSAPTATSPMAASSASANGVNAGANVALMAGAANPVAVGAVVKSQSGVQMGTIARLIPGANGYVSGVVLRTPSGALREAPISTLGISGGALVTTYNADQINALPETKAGQ
ncbi:MAG: hypothetical protein JWM33_14 [Caulobacteraceae bacterium]|nr:hypothetical protein [Caulobacteraceae bacterium]